MTVNEQILVARDSPARSIGLPGVALANSREFPSRNLLVNLKSCLF